jgi:signal transduction histidine kinase
LKIRSKLTNKIIILFSCFTFFLLTALFIYLYISSKTYIKNQAVENINRYSNLFETSFENIINDTKNELRGIANHIRQIQISDTTTIPSSDILRALEKFILGYPYKYTHLNIINLRRKTFYRLTPRKVFSGEIKVLSNKIEFDDESNISLNNIIKKNETSDKIMLLPINISEGKITLMFNLLGDNPLHVVAELRIDSIFDKILNLLNLPLSTSIIISDTKGQIYYASDKKLLNRNISFVENLSLKFIDDLIAAGEYEVKGSGNVIYKWFNTSKLNAFISFEQNISSDIDELNAFTWKTVFFSLLLFAFVLLAVSIASNRLSKPLNKITDVSKKVSEGDYSQKIDIQRNDEIGFLINSFNEMVEKVKQSYNDLNTVNAELELKIDELIKTKNELSRKEKLALIGETISKISHEIQNKIGGVSIWVQNLEMNVQDESSKSYIVEMKNALNSFLEMLVNFKRFYRQPKLNLIEANINDLLEKILVDYTLDINAKGLKIIKQLDTETPNILIDIEQIEDAFINLLINAVYYSPEKGEIFIESKMEDENIIIVFTNEGPPINDDEKEKIFQPFYTTKSSGSGLGLAIVYNIIDAHSGSIDAKNIDGTGVCFEITLPILNK